MKHYSIIGNGKCESLRSFIYGLISSQVSNLNMLEKGSEVSNL